MCIYMHAYLHACVQSLHVCACIFTYVYICIHACLVYMRVYACLHVYTLIYMFVCVYAFICLHTCMPRLHVCVYMFTCTHTDLCNQAHGRDNKASKTTSRTMLQRAPNTQHAARSTACCLDSLASSLGLELLY